MSSEGDSIMSVKESAPLLLTAAAGGVVLLTMSGCYDPYYVGGAVGYQTPHVGTVIAYQEPWYDYYYYPSIGVYFNYRSGYYYHHYRGRWRHARRLPRHIHINQRDRVHLRMRGDRPYTKYSEHRRIYKRDGRYYKDGSGKRHQRQYKRKEGGGKGSAREVRSRQRVDKRTNSALESNRNSAQRRNSDSVRHRNIDSGRYERHQRGGDNLGGNSGWYIQK